MAHFYILPITVVICITVFYGFIPDVRTCLTEDKDVSRRRFGGRDFLVLFLLCAIYGTVAFYNSGNTESPQSFKKFSGSGDTATIELERSSNLDRIFRFSGICTGNYSIYFSHDGENYYYADKLEQEYSKLLFWQDKELDSGADPTHIKFLRIEADSHLWLGEIAVFDWDGNMIPISSEDAPELCDEQDLVPEESTFLNSTYFDEIYHARTALEGLSGENIYEISHPPLGKIIISIGMLLFGVTPFGWRFSGILFGILMLPPLYAICKKMFGGIAVPACTTAVFAFDFMHFVQTRIATIDTYGVFFIILMYLFMYLYISESRDGEEKLLYLFLSGLCFGIGAACKWTCLYAGAGLAVIWAIFRVSRRKDGFTAFAANCLWCVLFFVIIPALIYYLSYFPYGLARGMTFPGMYFSREYFNIVTDNQKYMFNYHSGLVAEHPYSSVWYQWIFDIRPILYYLEYYDDGTRSVFGAFTNPALTWLGVITMIMTLVISIIHRDNKGIFIIIGYLAQLLPWVFITRLTFAYHYFPSMVFLSLSVGYIFNAMRLSVKNWRIPVYGYTALCIAVFILFYPVLSGARTDGSRISYFLGWLETWPF